MPVFTKQNVTDHLTYLIITVLRTYIHELLIEGIKKSQF